MDFGTKLKGLRQSRNETLHMVAVGTNIDMTLLSKFERKERIPTVEQAKRIAAYFSVDINELNIELTAERIIFDYGLNDTTYKAAILVCEAYIGYITDEAGKE
jgi:transcriptional regulator with XRE-family HTH domain